MAPNGALHRRRVRMRCSLKCPSSLGSLTLHQQQSMTHLVGIDSFHATHWNF